MSDRLEINRRLKTTVAPAEIPGFQSLVMLTLIVVTICCLYFARDVLIPITLAILLSFALAPLVTRLRHFGLPRVPSVIAAVLLALSIILVLGGIIGTQVAQLASDLPQYAGTIERKVDTVRKMTLGRLTAMTGQFKGVEPPAPVAATPGTGPKATLVEVKPAEPDPIQIAERVLGPILSPLATVALVLIVSIFFLMQREDLRDRIIRLFGSGDLHRTTAAMDEAGSRLSRYFLTQLALNASFGVVVGVALLVIGVPSALLWGIVAALFRFVPYIGSVGAALMPLVIAAGVDPGWGMVISVAVLFAVIEPVMGQAIEPLIYGTSTGLTPVSVVLSAIFWGWLWGPVGLILSMPLTLCLAVMGRHIDRLQFIDVLLGDNPALTPAESFYQRILAGDTDEAVDQAELLLRDRSLTEYYDEVVLKGLQLAAKDSLRGVLTLDQLHNIQDAVDGVVVDLATHDDVRPPPAKGAAPTDLPPGPAGLIDAETDQLAPIWAGPAPILCVGGRGPLDEAASAILAQLLAKHGLHARVVSQDAVARGAIATLDTTGVAMVCVSFIEGDGSPSALRYLMRRLGDRMPGVPTLLGLWQAGPELLRDERLRAAVHADHYVMTLKSAVEACVATAKAPASPALETV